MTTATAAPPDLTETAAPAAAAEAGEPPAAPAQPDDQAGKPKKLKKPKSHRAERDGSDASRPAAAWAKRAQTVQGAVLLLLVSVLMGGVVAYCFAEPYRTEVGQAARYHVSYPDFYPWSLDGGLLALTIFDGFATWRGKPVWQIRILARGLNTVILGVNAAAGWPSVGGVTLHAGPSIIMLALIEGIRYWFLRDKHAEELEKKKLEKERRRKERGDRRVPLSHWLGSPPNAAAVWRLLALKQASTYKSACDIQRRRETTIQHVRARYPKGLKDPQFPTHLSRSLRTGMDITNALAEIKKLIEAEDRVAALEQQMADAESAHRAELGDVLTRAADAEQRAAAAGAEADELAEKCAELEARLAKRGARARRTNPADGEPAGRTNSPGRRTNPGPGAQEGGAPNGRLGRPGDEKAKARARDILARSPDISGPGLVEELRKQNIVKSLSWAQKFMRAERESADHGLISTQDSGVGTPGESDVPAPGTGLRTPGDAALHPPGTGVPAPGSAADAAVVPPVSTPAPGVSVTPAAGADDTAGPQGETP